MRGAASFLVVLALAGCLGGDAQAPEVAADDPIAINADGTEEAIAADVDSLPAPEAPPGDGRLSGEEVTIAPAEPDVPEPAPEAEPDPNEAAEVAAARRACERRGGRFAPIRGSTTLLGCFITPKDANKACRTGSDCTGACLARSRTCAPVVPLRGCHSVILPNGVTAEQCRN